MRIRRSASRLLGGAAVAPALAPCDPPRFELPPPPPTAPANESPEDLVASDDSSDQSPAAIEDSADQPEDGASQRIPCCELNQSPWDLMARIDLSDPQAEDLFEETYFINEEEKAAVGSIKEEEKAVDEVTYMAAKTTKGKKNESELNKVIKVKKEVSVRTEGTCKRNDGKGWFCRLPASKPNSYCSYHSNKKPPSSKKPHRKRPVVDVGEGFYYYAGFGPSRCTKRQCRSSGGSSVPEEPLLPAEQQKEAAPSETHCDFSAGQADDKVLQVVSASARVEVPRLNDNTTNIASCDEALGWNGKQYLDITKRKIPFKKSCRKPMKARSLRSLM